MKIKYTVVIPTYNHCNDLLKPCIDSIIKYTDLEQFEIIIVANGCNDSTVEYVNSLGKPFKLIESNEPLGYTKATNLGIKNSTGDYIILMNNDIVLLEQRKNLWVDLLEQPFINNSETGITGPVKFTWDCGGIIRTAMAFWLVMFSREVYNKVGLLDEAFSPGMGEDGDYCIRIEEQGYKQVSVPNDVTGEFNKGIVNFQYPIYHKGNGTFADDHTLKDNVIERNIKILAEKYGKPVHFSIVIPTSKNFEVALKPCLEILLQVTNLSNKEIIVVANGAPNESREFLESLSGRVQYIWVNEPIGYVKAINLGINRARGKYIITLDDDSILMQQPTDMWIDILHKPFREQNKVGATGPFANDYEGLEYCLHSGCTMYDANLLKQIGMFDEAYNPGYFSDTDVSMKIWRSGYKCVEVPNDNRNKEYKNGVFAINFPVIHTGQVQTMDKQKDIKLVEKNRELLYNRYRNDKVINLDKKISQSLEIAYKWCVDNKSDINEHLAALREYASKCEHITEFGTRGLISTYALMAGLPKTLITYDIDIPQMIWEAARIAEENKVVFKFMEQDTRTCDIIEETDLLFIDTYHTYDQLTVELDRHAHRARKYIIFHDTVSYGHKDEGSKKGNGLMPAINNFLKSGLWKKRAEYYYNNGLLILERI